MNTFWLKMAVFAVVVVSLIVLVKFLSSEVEEATDFEKTAELMEAQEVELQAELAEAQRRAEGAKAKQAEPKQPAASSKEPQPTSDEEKVATNLQAQKLYEMAEVKFKIGRKPLMSFKKCVDYCRELIEKYPDTAEAAKARVLLRRIPERRRKKWNITDEELEIEVEFIPYFSCR